jgi:branched-chain amino acid transport system permease protein
MFSVYTENLLVTVATFILLSWGFYLPLRGGQLYNGPVFSAALGGYFAAYVTKELGWSVPAGFLGGVLFSGLFTFGLSFVLARLTMFQMAVVTIALIFIVQTAFRNLDFLGGVTGMSGIPAMGNILLVCAISIGVTLIFLNRLYQSRWGRAMEAAEADREMASAMGIDVIKMSIVLQTLSGILGGMGGVLYTFNLGTVHPEVFGFTQLLYCFTIVMVGGRNTPWGCLFFAPILWLIPEVFPKAIAEFRNITFGVIIIIFLLMRPKGVITKSLVSAIERSFKFKKI